MRWLPLGLKSVACWIALLCYIAGSHQLPIVLVLLMLTMLTVMTLALRLDYVLAVSAPEDLQTWTIKHLIMQSVTLTDTVVGVSDRQIFIEGAAAYHPVRGAFLAHIGGKPSIVLTPGQQEDK